MTSAQQVPTSPEHGSPASQALAPSGPSRPPLSRAERAATGTAVVGIAGFAGGYWNTGWDLIANFTGATAAGLVLARSPARAA
jgi:hypothetical protein